MKHFPMQEIEEAQGYAALGGQALHTHRIIVNRRTAPRCFLREVDAGRDIAHLFDRDVDRLKETALKLGVNIIVVEREGQLGQHIDLCGAPLRKALTQCKDAYLETHDFDIPEADPDTGQLDLDSMHCKVCKLAIPLIHKGKFICLGSMIDGRTADEVDATL